MRFTRPGSFALNVLCNKVDIALRDCSRACQKEVSELIVINLKQKVFISYLSDSFITEMCSSCLKTFEN